MRRTLESTRTTKQMLQARETETFGSTFSHVGSFGSPSLVPRRCSRTHPPCTCRSANMVLNHQPMVPRQDTTRSHFLFATKIKDVRDMPVFSYEVLSIRREEVKTDANWPDMSSVFVVALWSRRIGLTAGERIHDLSRMEGFEVLGRPRLSQDPHRHKSSYHRVLQVHCDVTSRIFTKILPFCAISVGRR